MFAWMREDNDPITEALGRLVSHARSLIGLEAVRFLSRPRGPGRPPEDRCALARAFVAKAVLGVPDHQRRDQSASTSTSPCVRILGWERRSPVLGRSHDFPGRSPNSRAARCQTRSDAALIERALRGTHHRGDRARRHRDRSAREAGPEHGQRRTKNDPRAPDKPARLRKRGRPRKGEQRPRPEPTRLKRQVTQNLSQMLADLPTACDVGGRKR